MAFPDLIRTAAYQEALRTPSVITRPPASRWAIREAHLLHSYRIREAGFRLDHLIRRALDPNRNPEWPQLWQLSAVKAFVEVIDDMLSSAHFANANEVDAFIGPRLDLAREIIRRVDTALAHEGRPPISSDGFRQEVTILRTPLGFKIEDLVFENPLHEIEKNYYGPFRSVSRQQQDLLYAMQLYWS
jgi:hypothetical protein